MRFQLTRVPRDQEPAPDGSTIFPLARTDRASTGLIELAPGETSTAVRHRTVEEVWYVLAGRGEIWRSLHGGEQIDQLTSGTCLTIEVGMSFQFRSDGPEPLRMLMVTIPPWPGEDEAEIVDGHWR